MFILIKLNIYSDENNFFIYDNRVSKLKNYLDITNGKVLMEYSLYQKNK